MKYLVCTLCTVYCFVSTCFAQTHNPNFTDLPNDRVYCVAVDEDYVYIGGQFTECGAVPRQFLARYLRSTGGLDMTWNPNPNSPILDIKSAGGYVYIGGFFSFVGGQARNNIARLSATGVGNADPVWNPNADSWVYTIEVSGDNIYIGGTFTVVGGVIRNRLAKLSATGVGAVDLLWDPNANNTVNDIKLVNSDLFVGGLFGFIGGQMRNKLAKVSAIGNGDVDVTWDPNFAGGYVSVIESDGNSLFIGGSFTQVGGEFRTHIAKLTITGPCIADPVWNPNPDGVIRTLSVNGDDVYAGGTFANIGGQARSKLAKISASGTGAADPTWSVPISPIAQISSLVFSYGVLYAGGEFTSPTTYFFVTGTYSVPTLGEWGMIFFAVSIIGVGIFFSKQQLRSTAA